MRIPLLRRTSAAVSPTAHYTGEVWVRHGLAPEELRTRTGRMLYKTLERPMRASRRAGGPTLEDFLLARHRVIDHFLGEAIDRGRVTQVVELAAGMSPRGLRFTERYGDRITYVETDLPEMADRKRKLLDRMGRLGDHHRVEPVDALRGKGPDGLADLAAGFDPDAGLAVVTEGLLPYLPRASVEQLWGNVAGVLSGFPHGLYLSDLHLAGENRGALTRTMLTTIGVFVRGRLHLHFAETPDAATALRDAGFGAVFLHRPAELPAVIGSPAPVGVDLVRVVEAWT